MSQQPHPQRGFSLIELLVGIVVAMLAMVIVMQLFQASEGARRTSTGGDDAQTTGAVTLALLQRDLRQAGQGLLDPKLLACALTIDGGRVIQNISGLAINHPNVAAGDSNTDTLLVSYGDGDGSPQGDRIVSQPNTNEYAVATPTAFLSNDRVIAAPAIATLPCARLLDSVSGTPTGLIVPVSTGVAGSSNGIFFNLGLQPVFRAYAVRSGQLTTCNFRTHDCSSAASGNWNPIAEGVVSFRVQYGRDTTVPMDAIVDLFDQTSPSTACGWLRITGLRFVLVVRNGQLEKEDVTSSNPTWAGSSGAPITLPGTNWSRYRYKTFETVLPLRNATALGANGTC